MPSPTDPRHDPGHDPAPVFVLPPAPRPDAGAPAPRPGRVLRASDAERAETVTRLHHALGTGRLDLAETDARTAAAFAARHHHELTDLLADLPRDDVPFGSAPTWSQLATLTLWRVHCALTGTAGPRPTGTQRRWAAGLAVLALVWFVSCAVVGALAVGR